MHKKKIYDKTFVYDLDDTLYLCVHDYYPPISEFIQYMLDIFEEKINHWTSVANLEEKIDKERVVRFGFKRARFPGSLKETYYQLCRNLGVELDEKIADKCYEIGNKAFKKENYFRRGLIDGAQEILELHKKNKDKLVLLTKGDNRLQEGKIEALALYKYFTDNRQFIVANKNKQIFRKIKNRFEGKKMYAVGNAVASDILPALEIGFKGIYIPRITWGYEQDTNKDLKVPKEVIVLKSLKELVELYPSL